MLGGEHLGLERLGALLATERRLPVAAVGASIDAAAGALALDGRMSVVQTARAAEVGRLVNGLANSLKS